MDIQVAITEPGGADVLAVSERSQQNPGPHEIRVRHHAIGVNFVDIYHRAGIYPLPSFPTVPGVEGAGVVEAVGDGVSHLKPGDRVAYAGLPIGSYASTRILPASRAIPLPDSIPFELAAGSMLRGLTVHMLLNRIFRVEAGSTIFVHATAGGLGQYLTHWAKHLNMTIIGSVSSEAKAKIAKAAGADHVIVGRDANFVEEIKRLTDGKGVEAILDGVGGEKFARNFEALKPFGIVASVGQAGGPIPVLPVTTLSPKSASLSRPSVIAYIGVEETYRAAAKDVLDMIGKGISATIGGTYPLKNAKQAHTDMESGKTAGSLLLIP